MSNRNPRVEIKIDVALALFGLAAVLKALAPYIALLI